ncbi:site-specific integrase [Pseudomonas sp. Y24-6]|uniref:site-specific integrase n=1 Tax=Pseudomonas sp. Y24-6 TaxID=2750013 RepID=UPI001CE1BCC7|nr:site-specific integrase [Pseudomonas sp. Y24-6]MCA4963660.1 site-specific integrase [Pseudomonas sp. Y24-6]
MSAVISSQVVLSRTPEGPLAAYIGSFANALNTLGYAVSSVHRQVRIAACFSRWLGQERVALQSVTADHPVRYLQCRAQHLRSCPGDLAALRHFIDFLRREGVVPAEKIAVQQLTPIDRCAEAYEQYLREARALARATIVNYVPFIRDFLSHRFGDGPVMLSRLCAGDVVRFVQCQAPRLHRRRAKLMTSALRSFLSYARYRGDVAVDLAAAVPIVPNWSMMSIPRAIAPDQVRQLLASIDRRTAIGRRDYAILLLLARLGLRSGEVASLKLDDIDWRVGRLTVCGKSGHRGGLPLPPEVGKAIAAYLQRGRPHSTSRCVFLRAKAPVRGFQGASGVGSIVRHALQRAGVDAPTTGTHQFRHGLATEMLRKGASLGEIGDVLGHRHLQTTKIYTKIDIVALRTLALPWPGGAQ